VAAYESVLIKVLKKNILTIMNVKLLAACVLLLQRGTFLVSDNYNLAYALQILDDLELGRRYASW
jgi:hypothetical protein